MIKKIENIIEWNDDWYEVTDEQLATLVASNLVSIGEYEVDGQWTVRSKEDWEEINEYMRSQ